MGCAAASWGADPERGRRTSTQPARWGSPGCLRSFEAPCSTPMIEQGECRAKLAVLNNSRSWRLFCQRLRIDQKVAALVALLAFAACSGNPVARASPPSAKPPVAADLILDSHTFGAMQRSRVSQRGGRRL